MRKIITIIASLMLVSTVFVGGAMAHSGGHDDGGDDGAEVNQAASAEVNQNQEVSQSNSVDDQIGVAVGVGVDSDRRGGGPLADNVPNGPNGEDGDSGVNAEVNQKIKQTNNNAQIGIANAQNDNGDEYNFDS